MNYDSIKQKIDSDPDYIYSKKFDFSLKKFLERYPDGAPPKTIAQALCLTEEELEEVYRGIVLKLRTSMKVDDEC